MGRSLVATFVLRLQDQTIAGIRAPQQRLESLGKRARRVALIGGAAAGLTFKGPIEISPSDMIGVR